MRRLDPTVALAASFWLVVALVLAATVGLAAGASLVVRLAAFGTALLAFGFLGTRLPGRWSMLVDALVVIVGFAVGHSLSGQLAGALAFPPIHPALIAMDHALWGGLATERLQRFNRPALVEWLQASYAAMPLLPVALTAVLAARRRDDAAREVMFTTQLLVLFAFVCYVLLPCPTPEALAAAGSPLVHFDGPLVGYGLAEWLHGALGRATSNHFDAFPSGHTLTAVVSLALAWRHDRRLFRVCLPVTVSIVYATLALRYHFTADVLVSLALAPMFVAGGPRLYRALSVVVFREAPAPAAVPKTDV